MQLETLPTSGSLAIKLAQVQDAQVPRIARKRSTRRMKTLELTSCVREPTISLRTESISFFTRSYVLCPHLMHSLLHTHRANCASNLQCQEAGHVIRRDSKAHSVQNSHHPSPCIWHFFLYTQPHALPGSDSLIITLAQMESAQVLLKSRKLARW